MTPSALRAYLRQSGPASLPALTAHFGADTGLIQELLRYWQSKGRILESRPDCGNKACTGCAQGYGGTVFYRWEAGDIGNRSASAG
jgi:hypothetical protein